MICPYCNAANRDDAEICENCRNRFVKELPFQKPLERLHQICNRLIRREFSADPTQYPREFAQIEEDMQKAIDEAMYAIEDHIKDIDRMRRETQAKLGELNLDAFTGILDQFSKAQREITQGLETIRTKMINARTSEQVTAGIKDYSEAMGEIKRGISRLRMATYESADLKKMTSPPVDLSLPKDYFVARRTITKMERGLDAFSETEDPRMINFALIKLEKIQKCLNNVLKEIKERLEEEEEELDEYDDVGVEGDVDEEIDWDLVYKDVDEIVNEEELAELRDLPEEGYGDIYKDKDWDEVLRREKEEENNIMRRV